MATLSLSTLQGVGYAPTAGHRSLAELLGDRHLFVARNRDPVNYRPNWVIPEARPAAGGLATDLSSLSPHRTLRLWAWVVAVCMVCASRAGAAGKRLVAGMAAVLDALERNGDLPGTPGAVALLRSMSAATIDRFLAPDRPKSTLKGRATTKPGTRPVGRAQD